jgi:hypothetical protein
MKTGRILRSSKILITMGETHRKKITRTHIELRSSSTKKDKTINNLVSFVVKKGQKK